MIDPAILRPGRLDVKIKIERPDAESARDIFSKYLTAELPLHEDDLREFGGDRDACVAGMIQAHGGADVHRVRGEPVPRGHLRQRRQGGPLLQGLQLRRDDPEHRRPGEEDGDQGLPRPRPARHPRLATCSRRASTSSRRTRTSPTPPTPTTGPGSPARRASGSSSSARSSPASRAPSRAARSTPCPTRASTSDPVARRRSSSGPRSRPSSRRAASSGRPTTGAGRLVRRPDRGGVVASRRTTRTHGSADRDRAAAGPRQLALGIVSCVAGIPITAIAWPSTAADWPRWWWAGRARRHQRRPRAAVPTARARRARRG